MISPREPARIGGEFELRIDDLLAPSGGEPPSLGRAHETWVDTGRSALMLAAREILRMGGIKRVWLPAYCCESVVQPFRESGFDTAYYPVGERLQGGSANLPAPGPRETLLFIHYFGHRNVAMEAHAASLRHQGVWVIEDCVQAGLSASVGRIGQYAVASYRKLLPQPDGALLGADAPISEDLQDASEHFVSQRALGKMLRGSGAPAESFLPLFESSEVELDRHVVPRRQSWLGSHIMARTDLHAVAQRRRANWQTLSQRLSTLGRSGRIAPIFETLAHGEVPLGLPVRVAADRRDALRSFLAARKVFCAVHWPLPHVPPHAQFAAEHALEKAILTLPIDQRMNDTHIERLAELLDEFQRETP